ncbi:hypothetical protein P4U23_16270 [Aeribacillus composti]|uniref:hypothetical protein n=1 Tax=Aeribacillus composti TaxID=1868734 RepID=UPI002E214255|nr:hypothetical protein [Aeribacillus composti]
MKQFGDVQKRAEKNFLHMVKRFGMRLTKQNTFCYESSYAEKNSKWSFAFLPNKKLFSLLYKLQVSYTFQSVLNMYLGEPLTWDFRRKSWKAKHHHCQILQYLNCQSELRDLMKQVDFEQVQIMQKGNEITIKMTPFPGAYIFMLVPSIQYFIHLRDDEIKTILKIGKSLEEAFGKLSADRKKKCIIVSQSGASDSAS